MSKCFPTRQSSQLRSVWWLPALSLGCIALGCDETDEVRITPPDGSGGSSGSSGSGGSTGGNGGGVNTAGGVGAPMDDAGADATAPGDLCVPGSLTAYCASNACPVFADAQQSLRQDRMGFPSPLLAIVQRPCVADDGSARISVAANYLAWTKTFIYDAQSLQLVGVVLTDDVAPICDGTGVYPDSLAAFHGERAPDCEWPDELPAACEAADAGVEDAGADAGTLVCVLTP